MQKRINTYNITFEEVPYYYYGSKKEKKFNEKYWGSPYTNKWCWELYTPKKQILELFDFTDDGYEECRKVEDRLIKPVLNDPWCLNERCGGNYSLKICRESGKRMIQICKENNTGVYSISKEQQSAAGKIGGKIAAERNRINGKGLFGVSIEQRSENGKKSKELGLGIYGLTPEQKSENSKKGAEKAKELGVGIYSLTKEDLQENYKKGLGKITKEERGKISKRGCANTNSQKWICLETGYISNPAGLSSYQRARGIDYSRRIKLN